MSDILILTGPPGAGKTSVAMALADRYDRVAHVNVDVIRRLITPTGFARPGHPEYHHQRLLAIRNTSALARNFIKERFGVIIDEVLDEADYLPLYLEELANAGTEIHLVQLLPSIDSCVARDMQRRKAAHPLGSVRTDYEHYMRLVESLPGSRIDSTGLTVEATADRLQALTTSGESIVWRPEAGAGTAQVTIRPREPSDGPWLEGVLAAAWGSSRVVSRGRLHHVMELPGFLALLDGRPAGAATYRVDGADCELVTLNSLDEGKGAGTALIEAVKGIAQQQGCTRLWLITTNDNTPALRFYQRRGFHIVATHADAIEASRRIKPEIPATGLDGIEIRDEIELAIDLEAGNEEQITESR